MTWLGAGSIGAVKKRAPVSGAGADNAAARLERLSCMECADSGSTMYGTLLALFLAGGVASVVPSMAAWQSGQRCQYASHRTKHLLWNM